MLTKKIILKQNALTQVYELFETKEDRHKHTRKILFFWVTCSLTSDFTC